MTLGSWVLARVEIEGASASAATIARPCGAIAAFPVRTKAQVYHWRGHSLVALAVF